MRSDLARSSDEFASHLRKAINACAACDDDEEAEAAVALLIFLYIYSLFEVCFEYNNVVIFDFVDT
jgi:hypothetical protein